MNKNTVPQLSSFINVGGLKLDLLFKDGSGETVLFKPLELYKPLEELKADFYKYVTNARKKGCELDQGEIQAFINSFNYIYEMYRRFREAVTEDEEPWVKGGR